MLTPSLMHCPRCANPTVLAELQITVAVLADWTGRPFGRIQIGPDTLFRCNRLGCDWAGTSRDLAMAPTVAC